jgi:hypothetical protein
MPTLLEELKDITNKKMSRLVDISAKTIAYQITPGWTGVLRDSIKYKGRGVQDFSNGFDLIWDVPASREATYLAVNNEFHSANGAVPPQLVQNIPTKRTKNGIPPRKFVERSRNLLAKNLKIVK